MKITVVSDVLGKENNGTTIAAMNLIRSLKQKGHEVNVVCPDEDRKGQEGYFVTGRMSFGPLNGYVEKNGVVIAKKDLSVLSDAMSGADVVHVMMPFSLGKAAALMAKEKNIALTAGFHCQAENITGHLRLQSSRLAEKVTYKILYNRLYKYCDLIHFPTEFIKDTFEKAVGGVPGRVISNGVDSRFTPGEKETHGDGRTLLFTGRYSPEKSHRVLIDAVALSRHKDEIKLILAGSGPLEDAIKRRAKRRKIPMPTMRFYGRDEMLEVIRSADLYVHPAEIEIESIACLEAIAAGRVPLIADSPRSASRYFALTKNNLFRYDDPKDLAQKIDRWLDNPSELYKNRKLYEGYADKFEFNHCMDEMEKMLFDAAKMKKHEA